MTSFGPTLNYSPPILDRLRKGHRTNVGDGTSAMSSRRGRRHRNDWNGAALYRRVRSDDVAHLPSARALLESLRGREIMTLTGVVNRVLEVGDKEVLIRSFSLTRNTIWI